VHRVQTEFSNWVTLTLFVKAFHPSVIAICYVDQLLSKIPSQVSRQVRRDGRTQLVQQTIGANQLHRNSANRKFYDINSSVAWPYIERNCLAVDLGIRTFRDFLLSQAQRN